MNGASSPAGAAPRVPGAPPKMGSQMLLMLVMFMMIFILFNPGIRSALGNAVGFALFPLIGFGGSYPIVTLMLAGMIMILFSTIIRHFFVDWVDMAKNQRVVSAFNKELRKARMENNLYKIKKLTELQKDIMAKSLSSSQTQMKLMPVTMLVIIPIFAWIFIFVGDTLVSSAFSVPWALNADLSKSNILPNWILIYSLMTLPYGQVVSRVLKFFSFRKRLMELDAGATNAGDY